MENYKTKVLFVGSFKAKSKSGHVGGQMFACNSLIKSELSENIDWILLDSTADSNIPTPFYKRTFKAFKRILLFIKFILFYKIDKLLIFSSHGLSFVEKGLMALFGKLAGKYVIFAPRSGIVVKDIEKSKFMKWWVSSVISKVDIVICQGDFWKKFYGNLLKRNLKKLVVIQNWLDIDIYKYKKLKGTENEINVVFFSWVDRNKGIFELIEAAYKLKDEFPNIKYIIGGKGKDLIKAKKMVLDYDMLNQFDFKGWILGDDKEKLFQEADIYVLPSYFEGFPNSLMEAMAYQLPCIATNVGSIPDLIIDGYNGLIIEPGNAHELMRKLKKLYKDPLLRKKLSINARNSIIKNNTIEIAIKKFQSILNK